MLDNQNPGYTAKFNAVKSDLDFGKIRISHRDNSEMEGFFSAGKLEPTLSRHMIGAGIQGPVRLSQHSLDKEFERRQHAAAALFNLDMMRTVTTTLKDIAGQVSHRDDEGALASTCLLGLSSAEKIASDGKSQLLLLALQ